MKEISKLNITQDELNNFFHTINVLNTLKRDENVVGTHVLSKYRILKQLEPLVLPSEITISNSTKEVNLVDQMYYDYSVNTFYGLESTEHVTNEVNNHETNDEVSAEVAATKSVVRVLDASEFNVINDAIAGAFKRTAELTDVETLKITSSIDPFVDREMHGGKCAPKTENYVPVGLSLNIIKPRYLTEDAEEELILWFENIFRALKK